MKHRILFCVELSSHTNCSFGNSNRIPKNSTLLQSPLLFLSPFPNILTLAVTNSKLWTCQNPQHLRRGTVEQALPSLPLQLSFHFPQPLQFLLEVVHSLEDILPLGIIFCFLGVEEEMLNSFGEQCLRVLTHPMETQHPLAGYRVVFVPVHWVMWMRADNFFVGLLNGKKKKKRGQIKQTKGTNSS